MNVALELPFIGPLDIDPQMLGLAIAAIIITIALSVIWRSIGKGALVAILFLIGLVLFAMTR
jgi:hypothetical protein